MFLTVYNLLGIIEDIQMMVAIDLLNTLCTESPELYFYLIYKNKAIRYFRNLSIMRKIKPTKNSNCNAQ